METEITHQSIPFSPPFIDQDVLNEVIDTLKSGWITTGPKCKALEDEIMLQYQCKSALCVNSWTSGAILMLRWLGVKAGDEVIVPAYTYSATALCVLQCGASPVMVDIGEDFTMDPAKLRQAITMKTKAVIPVDFAGWPCDYDAINAIIRDPEIVALFRPESEKQEMLNRIMCIADAAHSIGSIYEGQATIQHADVSIFSFHAVKNVTTGEGGCICLNLPDQFDNEEQKRFLKIYSLNGQSKSAFEKLNGSWKYDILFQGLKINMPDVCAAIGLAQMRKYKQTLLPLRKLVAYKYVDGFKLYPWFICPPLFNNQRESSYHLFALRINGISEEQRDDIIKSLVSKGIHANVHFIPMPMLTLFKTLGYNIADYPIAYQLYCSEISLPIYPQLSISEIDHIIASVIEVVGKCLLTQNEGRIF